MINILFVFAYECRFIMRFQAIYDDYLRYNVSLACNIYILEAYSEHNFKMKLETSFHDPLKASL